MILEMERQRMLNLKSSLNEDKQRLFENRITTLRRFFVSSKAAFKGEKGRQMADFCEVIGR